MQKLYILIASLIVPLNIFSQGLVDHTFFDFNTFEEQIQESYPNPDNQLISEDGHIIAELGSELFMLDNWIIGLTNSSSENPISRIDSYSKKVTSAEQGTVLGVRVKFPDWPYAGEAYIKPKFPLLPFSKDGVYANINNGVVTNVGSIKTFSLWANGRNFPFSVGVRVSDIKGKITEFGLGSLFYLGWKKLVYHNALFSDKPINNIKPNSRVYPSEIPLLKFEHIAIYKPHNMKGGDFVGYFGNMNVEYTPYITSFPTDIDDEQIWGIMQDQQENKASKINNVLYDAILQYEYAKQRVQSVHQNDTADEANQ